MPLFALLDCASAMAIGEGAEHLEIFDSAYLAQVFGSLLLVIGCLFGLAFLLKKVGAMPVNDRKSIQVHGSLKVGSREKVLLISAGRQQLLLGVAAGSVSTLHVFDEPIKDSSDTRVGGGDFASALKASAFAGERP